MNSSTQHNDRTETSGQRPNHAHVGHVPRKGWETMGSMRPPTKQVFTVGPAIRGSTATAAESQSTVAHSAVSPSTSSLVPQQGQPAPHHIQTDTDVPALARSEERHIPQHTDEPVLTQSQPSSIPQEGVQPGLTHSTPASPRVQVSEQVLPQSPHPLADFIPEMETDRVVADPTVEDGVEATNPEPHSSARGDDEEVIDVDALPDEVAHDGPSSRTRAASDPVKAAQKARERAELEQAAQASLSSAPAAASNGQPIPEGKILLTLRGMDEYTVEYLIRPTCPLSTMFENFLVHHIRLERNAVRFSFDGDRLCDIDTPAGRGMRSGDSIDCFWSQLGGDRNL